MEEFRDQMIWDLIPNALGVILFEDEMTVPKRSIKRLLKFFSSKPISKFWNFWQVWSLSFPRLNHLILLLLRSHLFIKLWAQKLGAEKLLTLPALSADCWEISFTKKVKHQKSHSGQMCLRCLLKDPSFRWWCVSTKEAEREHTQENRKNYSRLLSWRLMFFAWCVSFVCRRRFFHSAPSPHRFAPEHLRQVLMWAIIRLCAMREPKGENEKCVRALCGGDALTLLGRVPMPLFPTCSVHYLMSASRFPFYSAPPCTTTCV
jgi:hypothetical protein